MIQIAVLNQQNKVLAETLHADTAMLSLDRKWVDGDHIEITTEPGSHLSVQMDAALPEGEV